MVDKTETSIKHTVQDLPVIRDGEINCLEIGTIIDENIRKCAKQCGVYNDYEYLWIGSPDVPYSFVEKQKCKVEKDLIRIILLRLFSFDIKNGTIEDILKNKEFISLQLTEEEQQYWLTTIVNTVNKYRFIEAEESDLTYDQFNNNDYYDDYDDYDDNDDYYDDYDNDDEDEDEDEDDDDDYDNDNDNY